MLKENINEPIDQTNTDLNPPLVNNQTVPVSYQLAAMETVLKSNPQYVLCPYCKQLTPTKTLRSLSYKNSLLCVLSPLLWGVSQVLRNKDLNCYDAEHLCLACGAKLTEYKAC